ncbi:MAG: serine/threonine-protein kinase, partial [Verrucomicrobiota bacterium]
MDETQGSEVKVCAQCDKVIPPWAPAGNCPLCLLDGKTEPLTEVIEAEDRSAPREKIGDWELGEKIGEGAFGVVFLASQTRPVRRTAALKILRPGMASKEILARFQAESQALVMLSHPDVVSVYDAGATDDGRPYFAMEYVPGVSFTEFTRDFGLGEKLFLFDRVCTVVEHAHRRGIIHRDLKPANILAYRNENGDTVVKLLDFGIAKATEDILTNATVLTQQGHFLGTPEYMSPEQADGGEVDTRADIYSLGVILFELLVGRPPFVVDSRSLDAVLRLVDQIRVEPAPTPSTAAGNLGASDLDWIVCKAIEKNRRERYQSVGELREDLRRYSADEPILARPRDTLYVARKFFRRHWKLTGALTAIALSVIGAAVVSTIMAVRANSAVRETKTAYSQSDLRAAVESLETSDLSGTIAFLLRSLESDPENVEATMLLRATLETFPISNLKLEKKIANLALRDAFFLSDNGESVS